MSYAVVRSGSKQYRLAEGDRVRFERISAQVGDEIDLGDLVAIGSGADLQFNKAALNGKVVKARVLRHGRGPKVRIWKFKRRKGYECRQGHRQTFTEVQILSIPVD